MRYVSVLVGVSLATLGLFAVAYAGETKTFTPAQRNFWSFKPLAKLDEKHLQPNPPADKLTLLRRATLDMTGLPPTQDEIRKFLNDKSPHAGETVVDRLLASPQYGERWARHRLDVARLDHLRTTYLRNGRADRPTVTGGVLIPKLWA
jgi:hypothetical protein